MEAKSQISPAGLKIHDLLDMPSQMLAVYKYFTLQHSLEKHQLVMDMPYCCRANSLGKCMWPGNRITGICGLLQNLDLNCSLKLGWVPLL